MPIPLATWSRLAREVHAVLLEAAGLDREPAGLTGLREARLRPLCSGTPWDTSMAREALRIVAPRPRSADGSWYGPGARRALLLVSALRMSHGVLTGRASTFRDPSERAMARRACDRALAFLPPSSEDARIIGTFAPGPSEDPLRGPAAGVGPAGPCTADLVPVPFRYAWGRPTSDGVAMTESAAHHPLVGMDASDAPVAGTFRLVDGRSVEVRRHMGACLRPVLSPDTGLPIDVRSFREAARVAPAWPDDPWNGHDWVDREGGEEAPGLPCLPVAETAAPEPARLGAEAETARAARLNAIRARIGTLFAIDGVVHRACPVPTAFLARLPGNSRPVTAWGIGGHLTFLDGVGSLRVDAGRSLVQDALGARGWARGSWPAPWHRFHTDDAASLPATLSASSCARRGPEAWGATFEVSDDVGLPRDPGAAHESLALFALALTSSNVEWRNAAGPLARSCLLAADCLRRGIPVDGVEGEGGLGEAVAFQGGHVDPLLRVLSGIAAADRDRQPDVGHMATFVP